MINDPTTKKILIVEDDELLRGVLRDELERQGFTVLDANDGKNGLTIAQTTEIDLILLDIVMPRMDGMKMLKKLRSEGKNADVPVILLSNLNDPEKVAQSVIEYGATDFLVKSDWSLKDVTKKVKSVLNIY